MAEAKLTDELEEQCLDAFFCPITREIMVNPVTLISDGHTYEQAAILKWFETGRRISPLTGQRVTSTNTTPNHTLKKAISEFLAKYPEHKKQIMDQKTLLKIIELREKDLKSSIAKYANIKDIDPNASNIEDKCMDSSVVEFLTNLNQSKYIKTFDRNEIYSMNTLQSLTEDDLKEMIAKVGPRRVIYKAIQELNEKAIQEDEKKECDDNTAPASESMLCVKCGAVCRSTEDQDEGVFDRGATDSFDWYCKECISQCTVCQKIRNKNEFRIIDNKLCCDDCYKWCSKHSAPCLSNNGEISFGTTSWYCYKCMVQCNCGTWWRPDQMNYHHKGSG
eukprot:214777_1